MAKYRVEVIVYEMSKDDEDEIKDVVFEEALLNTDDIDAAGSLFWDLIEYNDENLAVEYGDKDTTNYGE